jgi:ribosomal protein S18 acetylase RimI-like enzyme
MSQPEPIAFRYATAGDLDTILQLRDEAAHWLAATGSDQWQDAWPTPDQQAERIAASIAARETWMLQADDNIVGTVAVDEYADPALWTPAERAEPAFYVHRLIVTRAYGGKGLGSFVLDWCCNRAAENGKRWVRIDVWTSNLRLQKYYLDQHFRHVRTIHSDYPSGALFQRPAAIIRQAPPTLPGDP